MLQGETIGSGAPSTCPDCKKKLELRVLFSGAGYYVGTRCNCGPSRESGYYGTIEDAEEGLEALKLDPQDPQHGRY